MDLNYVGIFPWDRSYCQPPLSNMTSCCTTLLSLFGIAIGQRLRLTGLFRLPNATASAACLADFSSNLSALSLPSDLVHTCFPSPQRFVITPDFCAGILTRRNWTAKLGPSTAIDSACRSDLSIPTECYACANAGVAVTAQLTDLDGNASHATQCLYLAVDYAAGVANQFGPEDPRAAGCIFSLALSSLSSPPTHSKSHTATSIAPIAATLALVLLLSALAFAGTAIAQGPVPSLYRIIPISPVAPAGVRAFRFGDTLYVSQDRSEPGRFADSLLPMTRAPRLE